MKNEDHNYFDRDFDRDEIIEYTSPEELISFIEVQLSIAFVSLRKAKNKIFF